MIIKTLAKQQFRYDTLENWNTANPVLLRGEVGIAEINGKPKMKIGNGVDDWNTLPFISNGDDTINVSWNDITGKPSTFTPSEHNHNNLYNTKGEVESKLGEKQDYMKEVTNEEILAILNS